jgi:hypothetical protein
VGIMGDPLTSSGEDGDSQIDSEGDAAHHRDVIPSRSERQLRRLAERQGLQLVVNRRCRDPRGGLFDGYGLIDWERGLVVLGGGMPVPSCDLDEIDDLVHTPAEERESWWDAW